MLKYRILIGLALVGLFAFVMWLDHTHSSRLGFFIMASIACVAGLCEFYRMASTAERQPQAPVGIAAMLMLILAQWVAHQDHSYGRSEYVQLILFFLVLLLLSFGVIFPRTTNLNSIAVTTFGVLYLWLPFHFTVSLRHLPFGGELVIFLVAVSKSCDIFAYFVGNAAGRYALAPTISPRKTVEGTCAGLVASAIIGIVAWKLLGLDRFALSFGVRISPLVVAVIGLFTGLTAQIGDLLESFLKRQCNAKDSSNLLPAFGGILDVIDSFTISAPAAYFVFMTLMNGQVR